MPEQSSKQNLHVVTLSPEQQVVLRYMLSDYFKRKAETMIALASIKSPETADKLIGRFNWLFAHHDTCSAGLPTSRGLKGARPRMIYLTSTAMQHMVDAAESFDFSKSDVDDADVNLVERVSPKLVSLLKTAYGFTYSVDEIKKAGATTT